jgi:DNA-nicking Smr family endonuclease
MDFGDILDQWERRRSGAHPGGKTAGPPEPAPKAHPMDIWLRTASSQGRSGIYDKDAEMEDEGRRSGEKRRRLRVKKADAVIDIHGLTRDEAWEALERFFDGARERGLEKLLIIHGKGNHSAGEAVLKRIVREFIERCPCAGESGQETAAGGGKGATWVLLKYGE